MKGSIARVGSVGPYVLERTKCITTPLLVSVKERALSSFVPCDQLDGPSFPKVAPTSWRLTSRLRPRIGVLGLPTRQMTGNAPAGESPLGRLFGDGRRLLLALMTRCPRDGIGPSGMLIPARASMLSDRWRKPPAVSATSLLSVLLQPRLHLRNLLFPGKARRRITTP